jgi:hypothetical protein
MVEVVKKREPIGYVVRDVTGETQVSIRFALRGDARSFAEKCAMPVRIWRVVSKRNDKRHYPSNDREGHPWRECTQCATQSPLSSESDG